MKILGIDTTASAASVAVCDEEKILTEFYSNIKVTHSQTFMPMTDAALKLIGLNFSDIDLFAAAVGPGSFTGVRIGISAVKGMAMAVDKPCIGVSTLEALADNAAFSFNGIVCAVMDARCSQVYNALFDLKNGLPSRLCEDRAITINELKKELENFAGRGIMLLGDGTAVCESEICHDLKNVRPAPENIRYQRASSVAAVAKRLTETSPESIVDAALLNPVYLRPPQAERNYKKQ